jgi:hypothetical protein
VVVVVDAYNVIRFFGKKAIGPQVSDAERHDFCRKMRAYLDKRKTTIKKMLLVFDGGSLSYPEKRVVGEVAEVYVGYRQTADDWIFNYVVESRHPHCVVISDDRGLAKKVVNFVEGVIGAADFKGLVSIALAQEPAVNKSGTLQVHKKSVLVEYLHDDDIELVDRDVLRGLMEQSTKKVSEKHTDHEREVSVRHQQESDHMISKNDARVLRILKKL